VDKFQGREAPIVLYSMATSSPEDAPRGMEFLYSMNRLNVAVSRARCVAVIVANPDLFDVQCKTPRQIELTNAFLPLSGTGGNGVGHAFVGSLREVAALCGLNVCTMSSVWSLMMASIPHDASRNMDAGSLTVQANNLRPAA